MLSTLRVFPVIALFAAIPAPVGACVVFLPPDQRLEVGYGRTIISAVAIVRVREASYTSARQGDYHPWQASAVVEQIILGSISDPSVRFNRGYGSAACDDGHPVPAVGERWVVYFSRHGHGGQFVWQTTQKPWPAPPMPGSAATRDSQTSNVADSPRR